LLPPPLFGDGTGPSPLRCFSPLSISKFIGSGQIFSIRSLFSPLGQRAILSFSCVLQHSLFLQELGVSFTSLLPRVVPFFRFLPTPLHNYCGSVLTYDSFFLTPDGLDVLLLTGFFPSLSWIASPLIIVPAPPLRFGEKEFLFIGFFLFLYDRCLPAFSYPFLTNFFLKRYGLARSDLVFFPLLLALHPLHMSVTLLPFSAFLPPPILPQPPFQKLPSLSSRPAPVLLDIAFFLPHLSTVDLFPRKELFAVFFPCSDFPSPYHVSTFDSFWSSLNRPVF